MNIYYTEEHAAHAAVLDAERRTGLPHFYGKTAHGWIVSRWSEAVADLGVRGVTIGGYTAGRSDKSLDGL